MIQQVSGASRAEADEALERVLGSRVFVKAQRSRRFLRYLVEMAVADPPVAVKEYTLAIDVFDRGAEYDPAIDATVRVEASRLRSRLREYYDEEGSADPLVIEVPKGRYTAHFWRREIALAADGDGGEPRTAGPERKGTSRAGEERGGRVRRWWAAAMACMAIGVAAGVLWVRPMRLGRGPVASGQVATSLAILPIANGTGDGTLDGVADGMTDELIRQLSEVPALRLMAHGSVFRYRGPVDARAIGRRLGVARVMTGTLRGGGTDRALLAEVSDTRDGAVVLSREYRVEMGDLRLVGSGGAARCAGGAGGGDVGAGSGAWRMPANGAAVPGVHGRRVADAGRISGRGPCGDSAFEQAVALDSRFALGGLVWRRRTRFWGCILSRPGSRCRPRGSWRGGRWS